MYDPNTVASRIPNNLRITKVFMVVTRNDYNDMFHRALTVNATRQNLNALSQTFDQYQTSSAGTISLAALSRGSANLMSLSATAGKQVVIANGWRTKRLRFLMEVEDHYVGDVIGVSYIQGFSDYYDPSLSGVIDEHMPIHINSITNIMKTIDPSTGKYALHVRDSFNVVSDIYGNSRYEADLEMMKLIRPRDIVNNMAIETSGFGNHFTNINKSDNYTDNVTTSSRANNDPLRHLEKTINGYITAATLTNMGTDEADIYRSAAANTGETALLSIKFTDALFAVTGNPSPTTFTLDQLSKIDPNIASKITLFDNTNYMNMVSSSPDLSFVDSGNTEHHYKMNMETIIAHNVVNSVNAYLTANMLTTLSFTTTNFYNGVTTIIVDANSFISDIDIRPFIDRVKNSIDTIMMPAITQDNMIAVNIAVSADVLGDSTVSVAIGASAPVIYRMPTFADSLYTPVIADRTHSAGVIGNVKDVLDEVTTHIYSAPSQYAERLV